MQNSLVWVDQQGKTEPIVSFKAPFHSPRLSPNGQRIAYVTLGFERYVWVYDLQRGTATKLTSEGVSTFAAWSPDGQRVVFDWHKTGVPNLYWQRVDGSLPMERLTQSDYSQLAGSWSPDGGTLAFLQPRPETGRGILLLNLRDRQAVPYLNSQSNESYPGISPDGKWMAYVSDESGRSEVYVQPFPASGSKLQISTDGGVEPLWAHNGKRLFYRSAVPGFATQAWLVEVQTGPGFSASKPKLLFEKPGYSSGTPLCGWDISHDGERFLMVELEERTSQPLTEMVLVENWFEEVRRLAATRK